LADTSAAVKASRDLPSDGQMSAFQHTEGSMRKLALTIAAAATILFAGSLASNRAEAMTPGSTAGVRLAADAVDPIENVACWRWGWRGWGWYPCVYYGGWGYPAYHPGWRGYGWRGGYGWGGGRWGWRRW